MFTEIDKEKEVKRINTEIYFNHYYYNDQIHYSIFLRTDYNKMPYNDTSIKIADYKYVQFEDYTKDYFEITNFYSPYSNNILTENEKKIKDDVINLIKFKSKQLQIGRLETEAERKEFLRTDRFPNSKLPCIIRSDTHESICTFEEIVVNEHIDEYLIKEWSKYYMKDDLDEEHKKIKNDAILYLNKMTQRARFQHECVLESEKRRNKKI